MATRNSLSRMHFDDLAVRLKRCKPRKPVAGEAVTAVEEITYSASMEMWRTCVEDAGRHCMEFSDRIDIGRFYAACDYEQR